MYLNQSRYINLVLQDQIKAKLNIWHYEELVFSFAKFIAREK